MITKEDELHEHVNSSRRILRSLEEELSHKQYVIFEDILNEFEQIIEGDIE